MPRQKNIDVGKMVGKDTKTQCEISTYGSNYPEFAEWIEFLQKLTAARVEGVEGLTKWINGGESTRLIRAVLQADLSGNTEDLEQLVDAIKARKRVSTDGSADPIRGWLIWVYKGCDGRPPLLPPETIEGIQMKIGKIFEKDINTSQLLEDCKKLGVPYIPRPPGRPKLP